MVNSDESKVSKQSDQGESLKLKPRFDEFFAKDGSKDYTVFKERVELFFDANCVPVERQPTLFLNCISQCVYKIIHDRVAPEVPKNKSIEELFKILDSHYVSKTNKRAERFKFNKVVQESGESMADYLARIRDAASDCNFGDYVKAAGIEKLNNTDVSLLRAKSLEDHIIDRFVMGIKCTRIQQALLADDPVSLEKAYEKARTMQMAMEERNTNGDDGEVLVIRGRAGGRQERNRGRERSNSSNKYRSVSRERNADHSGRESRDQCGRCGRPSHHISSCPARDVICHKCRRQGHFAKWCQVQKSKNYRIENTD